MWTCQDHTMLVLDKDSMISGSSSDAESLSSSVEMNIIVQSDSSGRLDISSAVCASSEGDTSSMDASIVTALDLSHGPSVANIKGWTVQTNSKGITWARISVLVSR